MKVWFRDIVFGGIALNKKDKVIAGTKIPWEMQEIWKIQLELLDAFQKFCKENNLTYYMGYGSLLGAVRHNGFVPWDDDIDVLMPREDFDRLQSMWQAFPAPFFLQSHVSEPRYWHNGMMRLRRDDTAFIQPLDWDKDFHQGICLEIMPLDVCAVEGPERLAQWNDVKKYQQMMWAKYYGSKDSLGGLGAANMTIQGWLGLQTEATKYTFSELQDLYMEACHRHGGEKTGTLAIFSSPPSEEGFLNFPEAAFEGVVDIDFEGRTVPAPKGYAQVLAKVYGPRFMNLLPPEHRTPHHVAFWSWDESYAVWKNRFTKVFDDIGDKVIVLFGTGNMLKDYDRYTKGAYGPAFYVDNDKSKWGTTLNGCEIKSPQALLEVPADKLHLIICNVYYREIGAQLRAMGIKDYYIYTETLAGLFRTPFDIREKGRQNHYEVGYVQGTFDLFHIGHLNLLRRAKERCDYLLVGVVSDELNEVYKGVSPFVPYQERSEVVAGCRYVDEVIKVDVGSDDKLKIWEKHRYDCHFCGDDHGNWEPLINALHERGSEVEFFPYTESTSSTRIKEEVKKRILYHEDDVMSFDVFDTLVTRKVATPRGIFALMQQRLADESVVPGLPLRVRKGFYDMRWYYEMAARKKWQNDQIEDITFAQIYQYLGEAEGLAPEQLQGLKDLELAVERDNLVGIDANIRQLKQLLSAGHRVMLISDMYLSGAQIRSLLVTVDEVFKDLPIYSSADMLKTKWSGNGYKQVQKQEKLDIFHWVHTGDNKASDIGQAQAWGIKTIYYNGAALTRREGELLNRHEGDVSLQLAVGQLRLRRLQGEDVSLDVLKDLPDEQEVPFGLANRYPVGVLADRMALYGAGRMGRDLYARLQHQGKAVVCWVDKQADALQSQGLPVEPIARLQQNDFDLVAVAVKSWEQAGEIIDELGAMGIDREKIFWT